MSYIIMESPIGELTLIDNNNGSLTKILFGNSPDGGQDMLTPVLALARFQLNEYFYGNRTNFDIPLDMHGTSFQKRVWLELQKIPFGETRSYGDIARAAGSPKAFRAVGGANHNNPIPVIVPCHRVIGSNNKLTGYAGGLDKKIWLLEHENVFLN